MARWLLAIALAASPEAGRFDGLCERIEPVSKAELTWEYGSHVGRVMEDYKYGNRFDPATASLPRARLRLRSPDPVSRLEAVAAIAAMKPAQGTPSPELIRPLVALLDRESNAEVIEAVLRTLVDTATTELAPLLDELLTCHRDPALTSAALSAVPYVPDPALRDALLELWARDTDSHDRELMLGHVARLDDRRALGIAFEALEDCLDAAPRLMHEIGTHQEVPRIIAIYKRNEAACAMTDGPVLELIGHLGGKAALAFLRREFEGATGDGRARLARLALLAQLEPGKPQRTEEDERNCVPHEESRRRQLPYIEKEVKRLLRDKNAEFFRLANSHSYREIGPSLRAWGAHLDPQRRVEHWRRVLWMLAADPAVRDAPAADAANELVMALASRASAGARSAPDDALRDIQEAIALEATVWSGNRRLDERLASIERRIERNLRPSATSEFAAIPLGQLSGTYRQSNGFGGSELALQGDGTFTMTTSSDAIDLCTGGRHRYSGTLHFESGYLVLEPRRGHGSVEAAELLLPVQRGEWVYLVEEQRLAEFCEADTELRHFQPYYVAPAPAGHLVNVPDSGSVCRLP